MPKVISSEEVCKYIKDGAIITTTGITLGGFAEEVAVAIEKSFLETGHPRDLTIYFPTGQGNMKDRGMHYYAHEGLLKRVVGGHFAGCGFRLLKLIGENKIEAYNFPQGIMSTINHYTAAGRPGVITKIGLGTYIDPRQDGGKMNPRTKECEDLIQVIELENQEWLCYKAPKLDVTILRGSVADENGNISMYREGYKLGQLSAALAAKSSGGIVIAQVEHLVKAGTLHARQVEVPGIFVDYLVVGRSQYHWQTGDTYFNPVFCGDIKIPMEAIAPAKFDERKVICRRAAMELFPGAVINLGVRMPQIVSSIAAEEKVGQMFVMTTEAGGIGGIPASGMDFGTCYNPDAIIEMGCQFDYYAGTGLDVAIIGAGQIDEFGNVNVSLLNNVPHGCGGFIDISQSAKKLVFIGTFTNSGFVEEFGNGKIKVIKDGKNKKFVKKLEQISFSAQYAVSIGQHVIYVTERAVFQLTPQGLELIEIAPGADLEKDILQQMEFKPIIKKINTMSPGLFNEKWGQLARIMETY